MQETLGLRSSVFAYLHIQRLGGNSALPACMAGYKAFLLLVLGQTGGIKPFATQLAS